VQRADGEDLVDHALPIFAQREKICHG